MKYVPEPIDTRDVELTPQLRELTEKLAKNAHENWASRRLAEGWRYGPQRDDTARLTPCLVPYDQLPESERAYDRATAMETVKVLIKLGYRIEAPAEGA